MDTAVSKILSCLEHHGCISSLVHDSLLFGRIFYNPRELADVVRARIPFSEVEKAYVETFQRVATRATGK